MYAFDDIFVRCGWFVQVRQLGNSDVRTKFFRKKFHFEMKICALYARRNAHQTID